MHKTSNRRGRRALKPGLWWLGLLTTALLIAGCGQGSLDINEDSDGSPNNATDDDNNGVDDPNNGVDGPNNDNGQPPQLPPWEPTPATLHRLTQSAYRTTIAALFDGQEVATALEADTPLHGYASVGASELTLPPRAVEQYEDAAWEVSRAIVTNSNRRQALLGCDVTTPGCLEPWIVRFGRRAWRRPLTQPEVDQLVAVSAQVTERLRDPWQGFGAVLAVMLQSPHFLFRVEHGEPDPDVPGQRRYTSYEMASRISYFLWGAPPDEALLDAAQRGELVTDDGLMAQAQRLLDDPRAEARLTEFFAEYMALERLETVSKDTTAFPEINGQLRQSMRRELELLFHEVVFDAQDDFRALLTTDTTFVDPALADIYGLNIEGQDVQRTTLPTDAKRGGLIGRAAIQTIHSHATVNSPTLRGRFVRERLLCMDIPPPPEGVVTSLEETVGEHEGPRTLRQKLDQHRSDVACAGCHNLMDPLGFTMEHFDPIGRWRDLDNGLPIDATGNLDGVPVDGAAELGQALADDPDFVACVARQLYRHAVGHLETPGEARVLGSLTEHFGRHGYRFKALVLAIVMSDGFRKAAAPEGEACGEAGDQRPCQTPCGDGTETCDGQNWGACDAPEPTTEVCDGQDNDCDGQTDEELVQGCEGQCGDGVQVCQDGQWGQCQAPAPPPETCNGVDDDCDGQIDEDLEVDVHEVPFVALSVQHDGCSSSGQRRGPECNAAINRYCAARSCSATGFGPVSTGDFEATVVCLAPEVVNVQSTTYTTMRQRHPNCDGNERIGPNCNAAISRHCNEIGLTTGFGPLEHSGDGLQIACVPSARVIETSYTALSQHNPACTRNTERIGANCDDAIHKMCVASGHTTGFGPLENINDVAVIACVGP